MKRLLWGTMVLTIVIVFSIPTMAAIDIRIGIPLPPPIIFPAPPAVIVLPNTTTVYVAPDIDVDLFFWDGWWWRPWDGRWYRSRYYDRGWIYYDAVPRFYFDVDPGWRGFYRDRHWHGHRWNYERIPDQRLKQNWKGWHDSRHWERKKTWGVQDYRDRPKERERQELRHRRQQEYHQRPEVQRHEQWRKEHKGREGEKDRGKEGRK
ncbi:MAG: hypothetical protein FJ110_16470 [Deltaproteobacteria bacterium]|nr:hypothetical protein [Deltaproteobacteria bacterium]